MVLRDIVCTFCRIFVSYNCTGGCGLSLFVFVLCIVCDNHFSVE